MIAILLLVPFLAAATGIFMYQLNGKREIIRLDFVQFMYAFILAPIMYVWSKTLLFVLLRSEPDLTITPSQLFIIDTLYSLIFLFVFAFIVMHSVTKSINLKVSKDPLHDIFKHSEYFHLWISHLVIFVGSGILFTFLAVVNVFFPLDILFSRVYMYGVVIGGILSGLIAFLALWLSDPKQHSSHFFDFFKLFYGILFVLHGIVYYLLDVSFNSKYLFFWLSSSGFSTVMVAMYFVHRSKRALTFTEKIAYWFKHKGWDTRVQLFKK